MIALTANAVVGAKEKYLEKGFSDYLSKPIDLKDLIQKLSIYLPAEAYEVEKEPAEAEETGEFEILEFPSVDEAEEEEGGIAYDLERLREHGFDTEDGLEYCAGNVDLYYEMLEFFGDSCPEKSEALQSFYDVRSWKEYEVKVHALKSNARMVGANDLSEKAGELEKASGDKDTAFIDANHDALLAAYADIARLLEESKK